MHLATMVDALGWANFGVADWLAASYEAFSQQAATIVITLLWQGLAIAGGLAICLRLAPRISAAHRFAVWAAGFAALVLLSCAPLLSHFTAGAAAGNAGGMDATASKPWLQMDVRWSLAIAAIWLATSLYRAVDLVIHALRLRKLWKAATEVASTEVLTPLLAAAVPGLREGTVRICATNALQRPGVIGFFAPRILIPDWLLARLVGEELEQIVLHEAQHLRRRDDWTNLLQKICLVLFPLNPALWWIERRLCREREMACDEGVVRITRAPRAYAACLTSLAERGLKHSAEMLSLGAWQHRPELVQRVHSILRHKHGLNPLAARALMAVMGFGLLLTSAELARCPRMIAFVPSQDTRTTQALAPVPPQAKLTPRPITAFEPVRTRAAVPDARQKMPPIVRAAVNRTALTPGSYIAAVGTEPQSVTATRQPGIVNAGLRHARSTSTPGQQWVVLTAWEQVQTSSQDLQQWSDYESSQSADQTPSRAKVAPNSQMSSQFTVTRLVLRVFPAGSVSTQFAHVRSDWFVIQL